MAQNSATELVFDPTYIPDQQDMIIIDFDPSRGREIQKRRPALVISNAGYSKVTGLVAVCPITHAQANHLHEYFVLVNTDRVDGYINPFQFFTFDFRQRQAVKVDLLATPTFIQVKQVILDVLA